MLHELALRFVTPADGLRLGLFFKGLSDITISVYKPHLFTLEAAKARCAASMLRFAAYQAKTDGYRALVLYDGVRADNIRAFRMYQSLGFQILGWWEHPDCPINYDMAWDISLFGTGSATG